MRSIVLAMSFLCVLFSSPAEARRHHGGRLPWCGIYMGKYFGMSDRSLWVARNWARVGAPAGGPAPGVVVVWPHHVGVIVGAAPDGKWIVHSGNDGGAVRTRPRSLSRVIAYRHIGGTSSAFVSLSPSQYIQRDLVMADRPSSRASLRSVSHTPRASRSSGSGGREHAADAGADWRAFQQAHF